LTSRNCEEVKVLLTWLLGWHQKVFALST
jgi:hypothetical protein